MLAVIPGPESTVSADRAFGPCGMGASALIVVATDSATSLAVPIRKSKSDSTLSFKFSKDGEHNDATEQST
jgi:hypothetical protein